MYNRLADAPGLLSPMDPDATCAEIHALTLRLPLLRQPDAVTFENGLYFFYEAGEQSAHGPNGRIVRVGNHPRSQDRLKDRLWDHYSPNKNFSVFRKYLGGALLRRADPRHPCLEPSAGRGHWERQDAQPCPRCQPLEAEVTQLLEKDFRFRCVAVDDQGLRNSLEKKLIGSLSRCRFCRPSPRWLGHYAYSPKVKSGGLWNSNHVHGSEVMSSADLRLFEQLVTKTIARLQVKSSPASRGPLGTEFGKGKMTRSADLSETLLLIPCSSEKKGSTDQALPARSILEFLGREARIILEEGRKLALSNRVDIRSPVRPALAYYTGQPYATPDFLRLLVQALRSGLHCLIVSGGYGLLRPEESIHRYRAHLPTQTGSIWRQRLPVILTDYVRINRIRRTFGVFSLGYADFIPPKLAEEDWRAIPSFNREHERGSPMRVVPAKVGRLLVSLLKDGFSAGKGWDRY